MGIGVRKNNDIKQNYGIFKETFISGEASRLGCGRVEVDGMKRLVYGKRL